MARWTYFSVAWLCVFQRWTLRAAVRRSVHHLPYTISLSAATFVGADAPARPVRNRAMFGALLGVAVARVLYWSALRAAMCCSVHDGS